MKNVINNQVDWKKVKLDEIVQDFIVPMRDKPKKLDGEIPWCRIEDFEGIYLSKSKSGQGVNSETIREMNLKVYPIGTVLVSCSADLGRCAITKVPLITNQTFIGLVPSSGLDSLFLYYLMSHSAQRLNALSSGTTISYLSRQKFENLTVEVPSVRIQQKIASILSTVDEAIQKTDQIIRLTETIKNGILTKYFSKLPQSQLSSNTKQVTFDFITQESRTRNVSENMDTSSVYGVNKSLGFVPMKERIIGKQISRYKLVSPGWFAYNPMRLNIGSIAFNTFSFDILVSPDYVVFKCNEDSAIPEYLNYFRQSQRWKSYTEKSGDGSVRVRIYYSHLSKLSLVLPSIEEQKKIVDILKSLDNKIDIEAKYKEKLIQLKNGLMKDIFSQKVEVDNVA